MSDSVTKAEAEEFIQMVETFYTLARKQDDDIIQRFLAESAPFASGSSIEKLRQIYGDQGAEKLKQAAHAYREIGAKILEIKVLSAGIGL